MRLKEDTTLPAFKGAMLHGWLGYALKAADKHAFYVCYGEHGNQQPKPYMVTSSQDHKRNWRKNELLTFDITLFGDAISLAGHFLTALTKGGTLGFGAERIKFETLNIASFDGAAHKAGIIPVTLADLLMKTQERLINREEQELVVQFLTPVQLTWQNRLCREGIPQLNFFINQIMRRWVQLARFWVLDDESLYSTLYDECPVLKPHEVINHCYFENMYRNSEKRQKREPYGGLKGQCSFFGDIARAIPLLRIGEQLHVGKKTTFGLGQYRLIT